MMFRRLAFLFGLLGFVMAGAYLFIYLYRWEWNRALMAGVIFIAAEVGLVGAAILERMKAIEKRISQIDSTEHSETLARLQETAPPPKERFAWLSKDGNDLNVFIPFLMGAGLVASAIAWGLERVARATAKPVLERRLALRLAPLALPAGGLMGAPSASLPSPSYSRGTLHRQVVVLVLSVLVGTVGVDVLSDATQTRPDSLVAGSESEITISLSTNGSIKGIDAARSLWGTCRGTVPNDLTSGGIRAAGENLYSFRVTPALGKNGERRLRGCFEDATIDNIRSEVTSIRDL